MGWLQQGYKRSYAGMQSMHSFSGRDAGIQHHLHRVMHRWHPLRWTFFIAAALLVSLQAHALGTEPVTPSASKGVGSLRVLSEDDMRHVAGQGLTEDRLFQRMSRYATSGFAVEVLGDMATVLNPVRSLLDADTTFRDAIFNPVNPTTIIDRNGSFMVRVPDTIGTISVDNIRVHGSNGKSFGSVTIQNIDVRGTTIRVTLRR